MIFGHRPKPILDAIIAQITSGGMLYTFPHELDYEVGRKIVQAVPGVDEVRSPTRAAGHPAIRLARAYTSRTRS
jgi:glutamate-1-semialdehyde 2,1-aminomutase